MDTEYKALQYFNFEVLHAGTKIDQAVPPFVDIHEYGNDKQINNIKKHLHRFIRVIPNK
jgi:hypothetical protein